MKKVCVTCKQEKYLNAFGKDRCRVDGHRSNCKICSRLYYRSAYTKRYAEKYKPQRLKIARERRNMIAEYKRQHPCSCGETEPVCLEFHHTDKNKEFGLAQIGGIAWERVVIEIQKCVVVCSNCHKKIHAGITTPSTSGLGRFPLKEETLDSNSAGVTK